MNVRRNFFVDMDLQWSGKNVAKEFDIVCKLGEGSNGAVFKARHNITGFEVAIKQINATSSDSQSRQIMKEVAVLKQVRDPFIVSYFGSFKKDDDQVMLLMEYCAEGSLADLMSRLRLRTLTEKYISIIAYATLRGLQCLHTHKIIHGDVKPANLMLTSKAELKLADFGVSRTLSAVPEIANLSASASDATVSVTPLTATPNCSASVAFATSSFESSTPTLACSFRDTPPTPHQDKMRVLLQESKLQESSLSEGSGSEKNLPLAIAEGRSTASPQPQSALRTSSKNILRPGTGDLQSSSTHSEGSGNEKGLPPAFADGRSAISPQPRGALRNSTKNIRPINEDQHIGTPLYMAPELINLTHKDELKSDVWSLGITLYELAQGNPPYCDKSTLRAMCLIAQEEAPALKDPSAWSPEFVAFLSLCLEKDVDKRPSAAELLEQPFALAGRFRYETLLGHEISLSVSLENFYKNAQDTTPGAIPKGSSKSLRDSMVVSPRHKRSESMVASPRSKRKSDVMPQPSPQQCNCSASVELARERQSAFLLITELQKEKEKTEQLTQELTRTQEELEEAKSQIAALEKDLGFMRDIQKQSERLAKALLKMGAKGNHVEFDLKH